MSSQRIETVNIVRYLMDKYGNPDSSKISSKQQQGSAVIATLPSSSPFPLILTRKLIHELISIGAVKIDGRIITTEDAAISGRYDVKVLVPTTESTATSELSSSSCSSPSIVELSPDALETLKKSIQVWIYMKPEGIDCNLNEKDRSSLIHILKRLNLLSNTINSQQQNKDSSTTTIFPVGRLDKDSCGMLILTNSGALCERLLHPNFTHDKEYLVEIARNENENVPKEFYEKMSNGSLVWKNLKTGELDQKANPCLIRPAATTTASSSSTHQRRCRFFITLTQGLNRQIRCMVEKAGEELINEGVVVVLDDERQRKNGGFFVTFLKRVRTGPLRFTKGNVANVDEEDHAPVFQSRETPPKIRRVEKN